MSDMASSPPEISSASRDDSRVNTISENNTASQNETTNHTSNDSNATNAEEEDSHFQKKKRQKTSAVWLEFKEVELPAGSKKAECIHCKARLSILPSRSTSHLSRHLQTCVRRVIFQKQQQRITLQVVDPQITPQVVAPALTDGKLDMMKMRASEATFSAGSRVIDSYRASLSPETVQVLICGADWCRSLHGLKRKNKDENKPTEITLPIS